MLKTTSGKILSLILCLVAIVVLWSGDVHARGTVNICRGNITGMTTQEINPNVGITYFDYNVPVDLKVVGKAEGYAPGEYAFDPCVHKPTAAAMNTEYLKYLILDTKLKPEYSLRGWAWNTNLGFISLHCSSDGKNRAHEHNTVSCGDQEYGVYMTEDGILFGYAWSPAFGWIQFSEPTLGGKTYRDEVTGIVEGYAWTQAGVWMNMTGMTIFLEDEDVGVLDCESDEARKQGICFAVVPDPFRGVLDPDRREEILVADGVGEYDVLVYLWDKEGNPLGPGDIKGTDFWKTLEFKWDNNLRLDSTKEWNEENDAVVGELPKKLYQQFSYDEGGRFWSAPVSSYAPTSRGNISFLDSTGAPFYNESFIFRPEEGKPEEKGVYAPVPERNRLSLTNISHGPLEIKGEEIIRANDQAWINGLTAIDFEFRPAVEVTSLYTVGANPDLLEFVRGVREDIVVEAKRIGRIRDPEVSMYFYYEYEEGGGDSEFKLIGGGAEYEAYEAVSIKVDDGEKTFYIVPEADNEGFFNIAGAELGVFTKVEYDVEWVGTVSYYSNKLPRLPGGMVASPKIVVHGAIQAHLDRAIDPEGVVDTSGQVNMRTGRETLDRNLSPYKADVGGDCMILSLDEPINISCRGGDYKMTTIGRTGEKILYFRGNVTVNLASAPAGQWIVVTEGGSIFIDGDIFEEKGASPKVALVSLRLRENPGSGNIYIHPDITDIQAVLLADGAIFSYDGKRPSIDGSTGEPEWTSAVERADILLNQVVIRGAVSSGMNTIGGADWNDPRDYGRVLTRGRVPIEGTPENILKAQSYDLNYLRMFRLGFELGERGCPIDQSCGVEMCAEELEILAGEETITGPLGDCEGLTTEDLRPVRGDLSEGRRAETDYDPVYIYQAMMEGDSVIFAR